jgi:hypothetical protein
VFFRLLQFGTQGQVLYSASQGFLSAVSKALHTSLYLQTFTVLAKSVVKVYDWPRTRREEPEIKTNSTVKTAEKTAGLARA